MESFRSLTAAAGRGNGRARVLGLTVALAAVALGGAGCQSVSKSRSDMMRAVGLAPPAPPAEFICMVEPGLRDLPDTTRNGQPTKALLGKMYLYGADRKPAEADGSLTLMVRDATPRPAGTPARKPEAVNIDPKTLRTLVAGDERFGRHYMFVFPWPAEWADVTQIEVAARYTPNPALKVPDMFHSVMKVTVSGGPLVVIDQKTGMPAAGPTGGPSVTGGVPHPNDFLTGGKPLIPQVGGPTTPPATAFTPPPPTRTVGPNGALTTTSAWAAPAPQPQYPALPTPPATVPGGPVMPHTPPMPNTLGNLPPTPTSPPGSGSQPFMWPPAGNDTPPVRPAGDSNPNGELRPVVIPRL